jgi:hypothetical protein
MNAAHRIARATPGHARHARGSRSAAPLVGWLVTCVLSAMQPTLMRTEYPGTLAVQAWHVGLIGGPESVSGWLTRDFNTDARPSKRFGVKGTPGG